MGELASSDLDDALAMLERLANTQGREIIDALRGNGDRHALVLRYAKLPYNSKVVAGSGSALEGYNVLIQRLKTKDPYAAKVCAAKQILRDAFFVPYKNDPRFAAFCRKIRLPAPPTPIAEAPR